jgi:hypothetical protein
MQRIVHRSGGSTRFTGRPYFCAVPFFLGIAIGISAASARASDERGAAAGAAATIDRLPPEKLAAWIDSRFDESWRKLRIEPAGPTSDGEFVRRVFLDLIGRIPSVAEVRAFLDDARPDKRHLLVEELLQRGAFASHLANTWRELLLAGPSATDALGQAPALETWLKLRFASNMPYDQLVRELLTAVLDRNSPQTPSPLAFYQAAEFKPEVLAANASRLFLGVQVQCAQCHDHPFADWKQPQFWSFAAFFNNLDTSRMDGAALASSDDLEEIKIPGKDVLVPAVFLDGSKPERTAGKRLTVARWITAPDNPYFARAAVNRIWGSYFGRGFVQPVDDLDPAHPPVYPEVFDALAAQFRLHQYDLKYLVRVITATRIYQLSSRGAAPDKEDVQAAHFARMPLRRMTSDQVYASFVQATGFRDVAPANPGVLGNGGARDEFQAKFADSAQSPTEIETTILQALSLMNGQFVASATDLENSELLAVVAEAPYLDDAGRIETLFLAALSRSPEPAEMKLFLDSSSATDPAARKGALADLFWILLNSAEFLLNH